MEKALLARFSADKSRTILSIIRALSVTLSATLAFVSLLRTIPPFPGDCSPLENGMAPGHIPPPHLRLRPVSTSPRAANSMMLRPVP